MEFIYMAITIVVYWIILTFLTNPEKIVAIIAVFTAIGTIFTSFAFWKSDRSTLKNLKVENELRKEETKKVKREMEEALKDHVLINKENIDLVYAKIDKSNAEVRSDIKQIMWYLTNSKITLKGKEETNDKSNNAS